MRVLLPLCFLLSFAVPARAVQDQVAAHASLSEAPRRAFRVVIDKRVSDELDQLAESLPHETVRCLIGITVGDSAIIDLAWTPPIYAASENEVHYQSCPLATIAAWHNHLPIAGTSPEDACYLSTVDIKEALQPYAPLLQMVQVNARVLCWWTKVQISRAAKQPVLWAHGTQRQRHPTPTLAGVSRP